MKIIDQAGLTIHQLPDGPLQTNAYWIDTGTISCLVDPILDPRNRPEGASRLSLILATHGHFDHIGRSDDWRAMAAVKLAIHSDEASYLPDARLNGSAYFGAATEYFPAEILLHDQQVIQLDSRTSLLVIHTPGHTPGGVCLLVLQNQQAMALLTGDTLFAGTVGRVDLPGGQAAQLMASLDRLVRISEIYGQDVPVLPGHGSVTTLREEMRANPFLTGKARFK
ncbi:MAG: MBL fold metallo-hydrolase [Clostridia bacterium]|nr:MBL fold metallo-hydrolase [Clostridia bacterium]